MRLRRRRPGYVVLSLPDYDRLILAAVRTSHPAAQPPAMPQHATAWDALAAAVAMITARIGGIAMSPADLTPGIPPDQVLRLAVTIAAAALRELAPDNGAAILADLGLLAARPDTPTQDTP